MWEWKDKMTLTNNTYRTSIMYLKYGWVFDI